MSNSNAKDLLDRLVQSKMLELEGGSDPRELADGMTELMQGDLDLRQRAERLAQWLMGQEGVAELYATDEELASMLEG